MIDQLSTAAEAARARQTSRRSISLKVELDGIRVCGSMSRDHPSAVLVHHDGIILWREIIDGDNLILLMIDHVCRQLEEKAG